jgi:hypothetical protein
MASLIETEGLTFDSLEDVQHDTLTLLYPKFQEKIRQARDYGYSDEAISEKLNSLEQVALQYYDPAQVSEYLGRTPENLRTVRDYTRKTKLDAHEAVFKGKLDRGAIERRVEDARLLRVPDSLLLEDDELYKKFGPQIEKLRSERDGLADYLRSAFFSAKSGFANAAASMTQGGAVALQNIDAMNRIPREYESQIRRQFGLPEADDSDLTPAAEALMELGRAISRKSQKLARYGLDGRDPAFPDQVAQGVGSTLAFFIPGFAAMKAAKGGAAMKAIAFGMSAGGLEALSEAGGVFEEQLAQGASVEEALKAANMTGLLQFPVNALTDALGGYLGGGAMIRQMLSRGLSEMAQETLQGVLSGVLSRRKADGTPYTWGDLVKALPDMVKAIPETLMNEGLPAFVSAALIGAGEAVVGRLGQQGAADGQNTDATAVEAPQEQADDLQEKPDETQGNLFEIMNDESGAPYIFQVQDEIEAEEAEATRRFNEWNVNEADIGDGMRGEEAVQKLEEQKALRAEEITSSITPEPIPAEVLRIDVQPRTTTRLKELARQQLDKLASEVFTGISGETIRFAPKDGETWDNYFIHLTQGETTPEPEINFHRARALWLAEKTIYSPDVVFTQQNERRVYAKVYTDSKNMLHQVVIEIEDDGRVGHVYTSFIARDTKAHKNKALGALKKRLKEAKEIIFSRFDKMRTRPAPGPTTQPLSQEDASLQRPGENNLLQREKNINYKPEIQGEGTQALTPATRRFSEPSMPVRRIDPATLETESGRIFEDADPSELIVTPEGSSALGSIDDDMASQAQIIPGEIHANVQTFIHTEKQHGEQIRNAGYVNPQEFIIDVISNSNEIRQGEKDSILLVKRDKGKSNPLAAVKLLNENGVYGVNSAWVAREDFIEKRKLLSVRSATPTTGPDSGPALQTGPQTRQGGAGLSARRESNLDVNLPQQAENVNTDTANTAEQQDSGGVQALTSTTRRFFEPSMPTPDAESSGAPVSLAEIRKKIEKLVPWRRGKTGRENLGIFKVKPEVVRSRYRNDLPVIMHE